MNLEQIKKALPIQCESNLKALYEMCCEEYRRRLCDMWDFRFEDSWWMADKIGDGLFLCDWWFPLNIDELIYIVENKVPEKDWLEYCDFVENEIHEGKDRPRINFWSWFKGLRPNMLKE